MTIQDDVHVPAKRWSIAEPPTQAPEGPWPPLIGRLLALRGVRTVADARAFFEDAGGVLSLDLPDLEPAVERLASACRNREVVAIFGDFDVDGITSAALLHENLASLGARPFSYLPHRVDEGYGLNTDAIASLAGLGATLLITADCGTSSVKEVAFARRSGMEVIILDHHTVPPHLPLGCLIVNPKRDPNATDEPSAGGVAYYVLRALYEAMGRPANDDAMLDLVALSTVCDLAPMTGENRRLVRAGLRAIANTKRPGLRALCAVVKVDLASVDTEAIGYTIGPRLNAAGRMAHARIAFDLLVCDEEERAQELASELDALNRERREATERAQVLAGEIMTQERDAPLIMVGHEKFPLGIVGLVAARLADTYHRPAVVYNRGESESRASARSIQGFDITAALRACPDDTFVRFGGHRMAAGFTAENERLPEIKELLLAHAEEQLAAQELAPAIDIDAELPLSELRSEEIRWLNKLAPFGVGNSEPVFLSRGVTVEELRAVGKKGEHLRLRLRDGAVSWQAIAFRQSGDGIAKGGRVDLVYTLTADRYNGGLQLRVEDLRPAE